MRSKTVVRHALSFITYHLTHLSSIVLVNTTQEISRQKIHKMFAVGLREGCMIKRKCGKTSKKLIRGLDEVEKIVRNSEGNIIIISDHGNALGEWGLYGHPGWAPI